MGQRGVLIRAPGESRSTIPITAQKGDRAPSGLPAGRGQDCLVLAVRGPSLRRPAVPRGRGAPAGAGTGCPAGAGVGGGEGAQEARAAGIRRFPAL